MILRHHATYGDYTYFKNWSRWEPAACGDHGVGVLFFYSLWGYVCVLARCARVSKRSEVLGRWSLGLQLTNLDKGFSTKKAPRFFLSPLFFFNNLELGVFF
jgi:hypothetical protein